MKKRTEKLTALFCAIVIMAASITGCGSNAAAKNDDAQTPANVVQTEAASTNADAETKDMQSEKADTTDGIPKYIFLFIGDGMSYPQIQSANYYMNAVGDDENEILTSESKLSFMDFPVVGSAQTYDSTSFCPDSASTATSMSTGNKTYSGTINMDETMTEKYETIAEKLKTQKDYKIGVLSTVNINHATPAAFYAHQVSRNNYYDIGLELIDSNFDYFAGGGLKDVTGEEKDKEDLYDLAQKAGYTVVKTWDEAKSLNEESGKTIAIAENLADSDAMNYNMDNSDGELTLADYVEKGIEVLNNDNGFFMMVEGGKIDWACHANDATSSINDTKALSEAVEKAIAFYNEHPDDTLILVTGDHETGGLSIGYAGTNYDTFLKNLENQNISYAKYDSDYVAKYKEEKTDFDTVMGDVKELFGLMKADDKDATEDSALVLTDYELKKLKAAYERTMSVGITEQKDMTEEEYILYGPYEPFTVTITHILNNKSGINFSSYSHTALPVAVFAKGEGQELFEGYYDNTDIYNNLAQLTGVQ